jgi:hypothetical protein
MKNSKRYKFVAHLRGLRLFIKLVFHLHQPHSLFPAVKDCPCPSTHSSSLSLLLINIHTNQAQLCSKRLFIHPVLHLHQPRRFLAYKPQPHLVFLSFKEDPSKPGLSPAASLLE